MAPYGALVHPSGTFHPELRSCVVTSELQNGDLRQRPADWRSAFPTLQRLTLRGEEDERRPQPQERRSSHEHDPYSRLCAPFRSSQRCVGKPERVDRLVVLPTL